MRQRGFRGILMVWTVALGACGGATTTTGKADFTRIDSLTETYLMLQDTMLQSWNVMAKDENEKILAMHDLLHRLLSSQYDKKDQLVALEQRLEQLERIRFSQKSMSNPHVVEEYDFSSNSLITELISLAESDPSFAKNAKLQEIVDRIRLADQRVDIYRSEYDAAAEEFNEFLDNNQDEMKEMDQNVLPEKRPLFQMAGN